MSSIDANECLLQTHNCHMNASCTNTNGSYSCTCNEGFTGNGVNCTGKKGILKICNEELKKNSACL